MNNLKRCFLSITTIFIGIMLSGCAAMTNSLKEIDANTDWKKPTLTADLDVSPNKIVGSANGKKDKLNEIGKVAMLNALVKYNSGKLDKDIADLMVEPTYFHEYDGFGGVKITVIGYPARYKNFRMIEKTEVPLENFVSVPKNNDYPSRSMSETLSKQEEQVKLQRVKDDIATEQKKVQDSVYQSQEQIRQEEHSESKTVSQAENKIIRNNVATEQTRIAEDKSKTAWAQRVKNANGGDLAFRTAEGKIIKFESGKPFPDVSESQEKRSKKVIFEKDDKKYICYINNRKVYVWEVNGSGVIKNKWYSTDAFDLVKPEYDYLGYEIFDTVVKK
ncbi:MAG: hypothetical protein LBH98_09755 [Chitinispirillales bacterium]|jgi:hypothetical protein|nr:hypothetical protein [Chitinispirillales bacterium]